MPAGLYNVLIEAGADWTLALVAKSGTPPAPRDLTGFSAALQIRSSAGALAPLVALTSNPPGGLTVDGPAGALTARLAGSLTELLSASYDAPAREIRGRTAYAIGFYDLELTAPGGERSRLLQGTVYLSPEVTR